MGYVLCRYDVWMVSVWCMYATGMVWVRCMNVVNVWCMDVELEVTEVTG